jgi:hypothetical protein
VDSIIMRELFARTKKLMDAGNIERMMAENTFAV